MRLGLIVLVVAMSLVWGMKDAGGGKLSILDKAKQHKAYAETGSFGKK